MKINTELLFFINAEILLSLSNETVTIYFENKNTHVNIEIKKALLTILFTKFTSISLETVRQQNNSNNKPIMSTIINLLYIRVSTLSTLVLDKYTIVNRNK